MFWPPVGGRRGTSWLKPPEMVAPILCATCEHEGRNTHSSFRPSSSRELLLRSYNQGWNTGSVFRHWITNSCFTHQNTSKVEQKLKNYNIAFFVPSLLANKCYGLILDVWGYFTTAARNTLSQTISSVCELLISKFYSSEKEKKLSRHHFSDLFLCFRNACVPLKLTECFTCALALFWNYYFIGRHLYLPPVTAYSF